MARRSTLEEILDLVRQFSSKLPFWAVPIIALCMGFVTYLGVAIFLNMLSSPLGGLASSPLPLLAAGVIVIGASAAGIRGQVDKSHRKRLVRQTTRLDDLRAMSWRDLEQLVGEIYRQQGYAVTYRGGASPDGGVDLEVRTADRQLWLVQCKQWKQAKVGAKIVRELLGVLSKERAQQAIVVTCGDFTRDAKLFAEGQPIDLVNGARLLEMIPSYRTEIALSQPPSGIATQQDPICPDCGNPLVLRTAHRGANAGNKFWGCSTFPTCRFTAPVDVALR